MSEDKITGICVDIPTLIETVKRLKKVKEAMGFVTKEEIERCSVSSMSREEIQEVKKKSCNHFGYPGGLDSEGFGICMGCKQRY